MTSSSGFLVIVIEGISPHATTTGSKTGVDLEVVFLVGLQSTLLEVHARSLSLLKTRPATMRRCSSVDERPGYGHNVEVVMTRRCLDYLISRMSFVGHAHELDITIIAFLLGRKFR